MVTLCLKDSSGWQFSTTEDCEDKWNCREFNTTLTSHIRLTRSRSGQSPGDKWTQITFPCPEHHLLTPAPLHLHSSEQNFLAQESCNEEPVTSIPFHDPNQWLTLLCSKPSPLFKSIFRFNSVFCNVAGADRQHRHKVGLARCCRPLLRWRKDVEKTSQDDCRAWPKLQRRISGCAWNTNTSGQLWDRWDTTFTMGMYARNKKIDLPEVKSNLNNFVSASSQFSLH